MAERSYLADEMERHEALRPWTIAIIPKPPTSPSARPWGGHFCECEVSEQGHGSRSCHQGEQNHYCKQILPIDQSFHPHHLLLTAGQ